MLELLTNAEMGEADRLTIAGGVPGIDLMERAGTAVANSLMLRHPPRSRVTIVAGSGNNGGDGFVAARRLAERDYVVEVLRVGTGALRGDAAVAAQRWTGATEPATPARIAGAHVIIDALFGAGLDRPVAGEARAIIDAMNAAGCPIHAVDLPSGINGTTGAIMGAAVKASDTVTFFREKPGHLLLPGRLHCGRIHVADIGIPAPVLAQIRPATFRNAPELWIATFPVPGLDGHKYARGHAVVLSGAVESTGAARLAARGALRAGAGLVTIASPRDALAVNAAASLAVMVRPVDDAAELTEFLADARRNVAVLGPGGGVGTRMREQVLAALKAGPALVLDADALTSFAGDLPALTAAIRGRAAPVLLTPHEGEFSRLFSGLKEAAEAPSKLARARAAAAATGAVVLLKGGDTVVAAPDGRAAIAGNASSWLATAGSGDVLAGFCAGLLAQNMPEYEAACAAVWLHGEAGTEVGPGLISEDLPEALPAVYRRLLAR
ncbi:MAG: NAD(P)H-hydrate dehydratase [Xanthobacteraceae bacterium]|nr:NAD(P)H-hydrate dehydratase [Xanthobacteraceae bacterium]